MNIEKEQDAPVKVSSPRFAILVTTIMGALLSLSLLGCGGGRNRTTSGASQVATSTGDRVRDAGGYHIKTAPHLGLLFPSIEVFLSSELFPMKDDKNLHTQSDPSRDNFLWLRDDTPSHNPWLYLFQKISDNAFRFILFVPGARETRFLDNRDFPDIYTNGWTPGYPKPSATFKYRADLKYYTPELCQETVLDNEQGASAAESATGSPRSARTKTRTVDCREMFLNYTDVEVVYPKR